MEESIAPFVIVLLNEMGLTAENCLIKSLRVYDPASWQPQDRMSTCRSNSSVP